jgi:hypothetical protein
MKCEKSTVDLNKCVECLRCGLECEPQDENPLVRKKRGKAPKKLYEPKESSERSETSEPMEPEDRDDLEEREEREDDMDQPAGPRSLSPQEDEEETRTTTQGLLAGYEANLALWPARTRPGILLPEFREHSFISAIGFVDLVELRKPIS